MRVSKIAIASLALFAAGANAAIIGSLLPDSGAPFLTFSAPGACGACTVGAATITGGTIYQNDMPFADLPAGTVSQGRFLAAGLSSGQTATITWAGGTDYLSFLWGSPDTYNLLTVNSNVGSYQFTAMSLGFAQTNGNQAFSQYVQFQGNAPGERISSIVVGNLPNSDAFEIANLSVTRRVSEPGSLALLGAGLLGMGILGRRSRGMRRAA